MKISIITVSFNSEKTIKTTLHSVANQTYSNIEHIVIDGKSDDSTLEIVKSFPPVSKVVCEYDEGIYDAMNKGIEHASGDVVGFLNSDDWLHSKDIIKEIAEEFIKKSLDAVYGDLVFVKDENDKKPKRKWISNKYKENLFSIGWVPPHPTFYAKLDVYERYGLFNSNLKFAADFDIMCRFIAKEQIKIKYLPGTKVRMRLGGATTKSIRNIILGNIEIYNSLKNNKVKIGPLFFFKKVYIKLKQFK
jgi:glycosyltransferase involved in cell wall biosynthesis